MEEAFGVVQSSVYSTCAIHYTDTIRHDAKALEQEHSEQSTGNESTASADNNFYSGNRGEYTSQQSSEDDWEELGRTQVTQFPFPGDAVVPTMQVAE